MKTKSVPVLRQLYWLLVCKRVDLKILYLTFKALNREASGYMWEPLTYRMPSRNLQSHLFHEIRSLIRRGVYQIENRSWTSISTIHALHRRVYSWSIFLRNNIRFEHQVWLITKECIQFIIVSMQTMGFNVNLQSNT